MGGEGRLRDLGREYCGVGRHVVAAKNGSQSGAGELLILLERTRFKQRLLDRCREFHFSLVGPRLSRLLRRRLFPQIF